jgi:GDP-L-fucose synthase
MAAHGTAFPLQGKKVFVAGHLGMVGSALVRRLSSEDCEIVTVARQDVDLRRQTEINDWMAATKPQAVFLAAATVGGILANDSRPAEFLYDNLMIAANVIEASRQVGVEKLLFLGSSCIYPREAPQPMREEALLSGPLEPTNQWYAIAKISGLKLCAAYRRQWGCDFITCQPTNLYGPGDNFDLASSHVLPALLAKAHAAKMAGRESLRVWGTGRPRREFLYVDDLADACVFLMRHYSDEQHINIGWGADIAIKDLTKLVAEVVGFHGAIEFDASKPDGAPRKLLDVSRLTALGWQPRVSIRDGITRTYAWFCDEVKRRGGDFARSPAAAYSRVPPANVVAP